MAVEHEDGSWSQPVEVALPASSALAGVIEVDPVPGQASRLRVWVRGQVPSVTLYDLFAISNG
jgi:hypothetical protein